MAMLSPLEAAEQVGKSKSTSWRASQKGAPIAAPGPVAPETPFAAPEPPRRSLIRYWFGFRATG
jgi:hypothetical protein